MWLINTLTYFSDRNTVAVPQVIFYPFPRYKNTLRRRGTLTIRVWFSALVSSCPVFHMMDCCPRSTMLNAVSSTKEVNIFVTIVRWTFDLNIFLYEIWNDIYIYTYLYTCFPNRYQLHKSVLVMKCRRVPIISDISSQIEQHCNMTILNFKYNFD